MNLYKSSAVKRIGNAVALFFVKAVTILSLVYFINLVCYFIMAIVIGYCAGIMNTKRVGVGFLLNLAAVGLGGVTSILAWDSFYTQNKGMYPPMSNTEISVIAVVGVVFFVAIYSIACLLKKHDMRMRSYPRPFGTYVNIFH